MADTVCEACEQLLSYAPAFYNMSISSGMPSAVCQSIQDNTGFNAANRPQHINYDDMQDAIDCLIGALRYKIEGGYDICDWEQATIDMLENVYKVFSAINCELYGIWKYLYELLNLIEAIGGGEYTEMTLGVDYQLEFYNGFYTSGSSGGTVTNDLVVGYIESFGQYRMQIQTVVGRSRTIYNGIMMNQGTDLVTMRHNDPVETSPTSWIYAIDFLGSFSALNNMSLLNTSGSTGNGIWNLSPASARARWQHVVTLNRNVDNHAILCSWSSYADGYNQQLSTYYTQQGVAQITGTAQLNHTVNFTLY